MLKPVETPRVAVLGLTLDIYKDSFPGYMDRLQAQLDKFQAEIGDAASIVSSRLCYVQDQVSEQIRKAEAGSVDALLLIPMSYTASLMTLLPLSRTSLPIVIWNTQEALEVDESYSFDDLLMNHVTQGTQDVTNVLCRTGKVFGMESGHYQDREALGRLCQWLNAAKAMQFAKQMRVGLLGQPFQDMGDFGVDETQMAAQWGPHTVHLSPAQLVRLLDQVEEADVGKLIEEDRERFEVASDITEDIHRTSSKLELALRKLIGEHSLDAFSMNFRELIDDGRFPTMPFLGINKLLAEGLGYAGEGNVTLAAHMTQMRQLCGAANFTEIYTVDYVHNHMVMTHMQECNPALARKDRKVRLVKKDFWAPGMLPYVGMHFTLEPGPVTLTNITTTPQGKFFYLAYETSIVDMEPFEQFDIPHWVVELDEPVGDFLTRYSMAGGTHHLTAVPGHHSEALRKLAHLQGFGFVGV